MIKKINIRELKNEINLFLFEKFNFGLNKLIVVNELCDIFGGLINETLDLYNSYN